MLGRVAVLGPEGRAEGVHVGKTAAVVLDTELAAHAQVGRLLEEVLGVVHGVFFGHQRNFAHALGLGRHDRGHLEHGACALAVAGSDQRRGDVQEASRLVKNVTGHQQTVSDTGHAADQVGSRPQMCDFPERLGFVVLFRQRVFLLVTPAEDLDNMRLHFIA